MSRQRAAVLFDIDGTLVDTNWLHTLVIGDTRWDVVAAERAGLRTVAVLTGGVPRQVLDAAGAVAVYEDVADVLASLDDRDSPLGRFFRQNR